MTGRIHSVQSLGAVDGPGLRYVIFAQGCPLRCAYCHNPDTWPLEGGQEIEAAALVKQALRCRPYFGEKGGVTFTGGEPLAQPEFVAEVFRLLRAEGVHTALDTSGAGNLARAGAVLEHTDLVLADLKAPAEAGYQALCGGSLAHTLRFLDEVERRGIPLWVRHVVAPGRTDSDESLRAVYALAHRYSNLQKIEWLPFERLCLEKYQRMGLAFPMGNAPAVNAEALKERIRALFGEETP